jgi:membrane protease YdiL (CAAX protease family)
MKLPIWTIFVPGASYFYQKRYVEGTLFSTVEIGGIFLGIKFNDKLKTNTVTPYYNYPKNIGIQAIYAEKLANIRNHLENFKYRHPDFRYDEISEKDLYLAPFKKENILTPVTGIMVCLAGATLGLNYYMQKHGIGDVKQFSFAGKYIPRNQALAIYCPIGFAQGWGAGVIEEYEFRNWIMPHLDYSFGQKKGLVFSSLIFGAAHIPNFIFEKNPDYKLMMLQVAGTSIGGLFYGWDIQRRNYKIGPAVAAHMWFDTILMVGSFLINPENNYIGVNLKFDLN